MNDIYEINVAKAEFREGYNSGNVDRLLAVFADEFTDMSAEVPSFFGADARSVFQRRMTKLFEQYQATLMVTIIAIRVFADTALDFGWHSLTLAPRRGGEPITTRQRYFETWQRNSSGNWRIDFYIDNMDVAPMMPDAELPLREAFCSPDTPRKRSEIAADVA
ncbi:MAG: nuclear transport factor 2 family protein [Candidatus Sulfotelmatobacter sp.]|jgi:ketosteroid isomerase-like protein